MRSQSRPRYKYNTLGPPFIRDGNQIEGSFLRELSRFGTAFKPIDSRNDFSLSRSRVSTRASLRGRIGKVEIASSNFGHISSLVLPDKVMSFVEGDARDAKYVINGEVIS